MSNTQALAGTSAASGTSVAAATAGAFHVANGQIIDPNGNIFIARGIDIGPQDMTTVAQSLTTTFPGANFIRLATWDTAPYSLSDYENFVSQMTAKGVVVEIEDHAYPSPGTYTGAQLTTESNWYASLASAFANNPYVWFGTMNEPNSGSYGASEAAITTQEVATYNAIRGAGNNSMIMMELDGGGNPGTVGAGFGMTASSYASMTNIAWDLHYYGWSSGYSTDQATVTADLMGSASGGYGIAAAQSITSADGTVPVIIGEFGDSTNGSTVDANGTQVVNAVLNSGYGYAAWTWGGQGGPDQLTQNGSLTSLGQEVAAGIAAAAAKTRSADNTVIKAGSSATIVDAQGNVWSITSGGQVAVNGVADATTANVTELAYEKALIWQENTAKLWWSKSQPSDAWGPAAGSATSPVPPPASPNDAVVTAPSTASITDASGNKWTINSAAQVAINGVADTTTAQVIELAYVNGTIWQENSSKLWWGETAPNASWAPAAGTATSPLPPPPPATSPNDTVVYVGQTSVITDASNNKWSITSAGQVAVNGVADAATANVTELAYVGNTVWQENKNSLWWGKTAPTAAWSPSAGTATSPLPAPIIVAAGQASVTVSQSQVSLLATSGSHMVFISGSGDTVNLSGGTDTITDTGRGNTYVIPPAGKGYDTFTSNILNAGDTIDLRSALAASNWNGAAATLANYLKVADNSQGAVLSISSTSGGTAVAIATIDGATTAKLSTLLAHALV